MEDQVKQALELLRTGRLQEFLAPLLEFSRWELAVSGWKNLICHYVREVHPEYSFEGIRNWKIPVAYKCNNCNFGRPGATTSLEHNASSIKCLACKKKGVLEREEQSSLGLFLTKENIEMCLIPGSSYTIEGFEENYSVFIPPFLISRWPITKKMWEKKHSRTKVDRSPPKTNITWKEAGNWLEERGLRLLTVEEWTYASKGQVAVEYFWGDIFRPEYYWPVLSERLPSEISNYYNDEGVGKENHPVSRHESECRWNRFGLVDTLGNVMEWIQPFEDNAASSFATSIFAHDECFFDRFHGAAVRGGQDFRSNFADKTIGFRAGATISLPFS